MSFFDRIGARVDVSVLRSDDMWLTAWLLDKSAAARAGATAVASNSMPLAGYLYLCPVSELEQRYSARSARRRAASR